MKLTVGPFAYRVETFRGYPLMDGEECLGLCDNEQFVIYLSDQLPEQQRQQVLCHEYMEAWLHHFGDEAMDKETWCDLFGIAMAQFLKDTQSSPLPPAEQTTNDKASSPLQLVDNGWRLRVYDPTPAAG